MSFLRVSLRLVALGLGTGALCALWALLAPLAAWRGHPTAWRARIVQAWSRFVLRVLGVRLALRGTPAARAGLVVANHLSYLDVPVLASVLRCGFVAKSEVARWPLLGLLARTFGTVFVERERKRQLPAAAAGMRAWLAAESSLVLFPEGTSSSGRELLPFRSALLAPAVELDLPVYHAALRYRTTTGAPPAEQAVCWWGAMTFGRHFLKLLALPGVVAELTLGHEPVRAADRKLLARRLERAVAHDLGLPLARPA